MERTHILNNIKEDFGKVDKKMVTKRFYYRPLLLRFDYNLMRPNSKFHFSMTTFKCKTINKANKYGPVDTLVK